MSGYRRWKAAALPRRGQRWGPPLTAGGRQPPLLAGYQETSWYGNGAKSTPSISWQTGDRIVVVGMASNNNAITDPTATGLTFTAGSPVAQVGACWANSWTATAASPGASTVTSTGSTAGSWGLAVWVYRDSDGFGNRATDASTAKTVSLTRGQADSAVVEVIADFDSGPLGGYAWTPTAENEREASTNSLNYSLFAGDWTDEDAAGTTSYGITGTTSIGVHTKLALEVLGTAASDTASRFLGDVGAAADSLTVDPGVTPKTLADSGAVAEQLAVGAAVPLAQAASGADTITAGQVGTLNHWLVGAPTTSGFTVALRTSSASTTQVRVSTTSDLLTSPQTFGSSTPDGNGYSKVAATGLAAGTDYWYRPLVDGVLAGTVEGPVQTVPSGAGDFSFVFASCHEDSLGDSDAWTRAKARNPDFVVSTGDFGYADITTNDQAAFRSFYNTYLAFTNVADMVRDVPLIHAWSDHDFGTNNAVATSATNPAANAMYRYIFPHYPLEQGTTGIYHTFVYRRVRFIVTDNRSFKSANADADTSAKTVLGTTQKQWWKDTIAAATEPLIIWVNDQPWTGAAATPDDEWYAYNTERQELAAHVQATGRRVLILAGDMHALAADDGRNSPGGMPVFHAAPWRNAASQKGTPYLQGPYPLDGSEVRQYGHVQVTDSGTILQVRFRGYDTTDTVRVDLTLTYLTDSGTAADSVAVTTGQVAKTLADSGAGSDRLCHDGGPAGAPDCILASANLAGSVVDLWDDPLSPDVAWLTAVDPTLATDLRVSFPTPATAPGSGGPLDFQVYVRKAGAGSNPVAVVELWEAGLFKRQLTSATVTSTSGQLLTATIDPADLTVASGAQAELRVHMSPQPLGPGGAWVLQFEDNFEGTTLDATKWVAPEGWTNQNNVTSRTANVTVGGGMMTLQLSSDTEGAVVLSDPDELPDPNGYQIAPESFVEARCYLPGSGGVIYNWSGWWTSGHDWAANGEFDICEGVGDDLTCNYWHNVPPGLGGTPTPLGQIAPPGSWLNGWHVFGLHRKATTVDYYWDGVLVRSITPDDLGGAHHLRFNVGARGGGPNVTGAAGAMKVDYVRAWEPA